MARGREQVADGGKVVRLRFEFTEEDRRALNAWYGEPGLASHARLARWAWDQVNVAMSELLTEAEPTTLSTGGGE